MLRRVSVVIPALNAQRTLERCITSVRRQELDGYSIEIVVVDNGSKDNTPQIAHDLGVKCVPVLPRNRSLARNTGASTTCGEYLIFLDSDCEASPNLICCLIDSLQQDFIGAVQAAVKRYNNYSGSFLGEQNQFRGHARVPFLDSCALGIRRKVFSEINGFNTEIRRCEDIDISLKLLSHKYALMINPNCYVNKSVEYSFSGALKRGVEHASAFANLHTNWKRQLKTTALRTCSANMLQTYKKLLALLKLSDKPLFDRFCSLIQSMAISFLYPIFRAIETLREPATEITDQENKSAFAERSYLIGVDQNFVLLNPDINISHLLNSTALCSVSLMLNGRPSPQELAEKLSEQFDCSDLEARKGIEDFLYELKSLGLLVSDAQYA